MKKNLFISAVILMTASIFVISCNKENNFKVETNDLVSFQNFEEYNKELSKVVSLSTDELKTYEIEKGYESYGRICDQFYKNINFESFKTSDELINYVNSNNDYIFILKDENNELSVETNLHNNPARYFLNKNKMFAINKNVYKAIENYLIVTKIENIDELKTIDESNFQTYLTNESFSFIPVKTESIYDDYDKDTGYNCGTYDVDRADNNRDRTKIEHEITYYDDFDPYIGNYTHVQCRSLIRPYKRTLGIWYYCTRTISCNIKIAVGIKDLDNNWSREFYTYSTTRYDSKIENLFIQRDYLGHRLSGFIHFDGYNSWGDTPSTGPAELQCNTSLF